MNRPPGQIDAFVSSDEGSDMDVSDSEIDEPTITQPSPFIATAPSDFNKPAHLPKGGSFVSNMRSYATQQAQDPSNRITPRVEHFNNQSDPIQVDSDSDESTSSFHTAPSSPAEEDNNNNDELELEMTKLTETIKNNNKLIGNLKTEVTELTKKKDELNQKILRNKVRSSITKKRITPREIRKPAIVNHAQSKGESSKPVDGATSTLSADTATQFKGKETEYVQQEVQLRHPQVQKLSVYSPSHQIPKQKKFKKNGNLAQNNFNIKEANLRKKKLSKKIQKNAKKLENFIQKERQRSERNEGKKEISKTATEIAENMEKPAPPTTSPETPMEEGELIESSDSSRSSSVSISEMSSSKSSSGSIIGGGGDDIINGNGSNHLNLPSVQTTTFKHPGNSTDYSMHISKIKKTQKPSMQHTTNRNNFQPYKSALSSIGLSAQTRANNDDTSGFSGDKPLCTFEQNGGTCNNDSCQAAHFRDFIYR